ncbi:hypothetical protein H310_15097 [Aphanomyces invadans]|uniref:Transposase Tc1-like domain-containing protein n=1 Tax=Aphanomyces invadans TaxID=157072 RepID=A0A024T8W5_9STRA|nr:hypothetical protein H310_15097 [Aphanomyces invadans]ETV90071.1 hypothetical protein H310_15097 [Aphanomyces invadans]|eukprot:XP_008881296.1 hypothetical protein H310_15097 [Aphanomyces invadans]
MPSSKWGRVGTKLSYTTKHVTNRVSGVREDQRTTILDISVATGLSIGTIHRKLRDGTIERRSSRLKPLLTDDNMRERIAFCSACGY